MSLPLGLSFIAGLLTTMSPCVLPVLPFLFGSAARKNKGAPALMIFGLSLSFIFAGFILSRFGTLLGMSAETVRTVSALLLIVMSLFFLSSRLQALFSDKINALASAGSNATQKYNLDESSQMDSLLIGCLLGVIWSPCAGPTLGVAVTLAGKEGEATQALLLMSVYALGAAIPLLLISYGLRSFFQKNVGRFVKVSQYSKYIFGVALLAVGVMVLFNLDKKIEAAALEILPSQWVDLITKF